MSRLVKKAPSQCTDLPLDNAVISEKLRLFSQLVRSCFGPSGRLKQIHNNIGGNVTTTSVSSVLLPAISSSQPLINLIKTSINNHVSRQSDCGLFAAVFCLSLIEHAKQSGMRRRVFIDVYKHMLALCTGYLQREDCGCKVKLDFNSSRNLVTLASSVISSKPACVLTEPEVLHISRLCVQAFLLTVPCNHPGTVTLGDVVTVSVEGPSVDNSAVFSGLMVELPDATCPPPISSPHSRPLRTVLLTASLAGDLCEVGDGNIEVALGVDTDSQVLDRLLELGQQVVRDEAKLFVCQKVIHPVLQQYLRSHGVIVVERVGIALMEPLSQLTGAQPVAAVHTTIPSRAYGKVKDVCVRQFGSKKVLHLHSVTESSICTRILCHRNETMLSELKVVCQQTEQVLRLTLREPSALLGGGCTETHLAAYVRNKSMGDLAETAQALRCSLTECLRAVEGFCHSLESVAVALEHDGGSSLMDLAHGHHWRLPSGVETDEPSVGSSSCGCGLVRSSPSKRWTYLNTNSLQFSPEPLTVGGDLRPRVLDSFTAKLSALQVAVETANLALDVQYIIRDVN